MSNEELVDMGKRSAEEFLNYLAQNKASEQIDVSLKKWFENQLPKIDKNDMLITQLNY